jgi:hypothetical protein
MASCVSAVLAVNVPQPDLDVVADDLVTLANRVARNKEIVGLHYPSGVGKRARVRASGG